MLELNGYSKINAAKCSVWNLRPLLAGYKMVVWLHSSVGDIRWWYFYVCVEKNYILTSSRSGHREPILLIQLEINLIL